VHLGGVDKFIVVQTDSTLSKPFMHTSEALSEKDAADALRKLAVPEAEIKRWPRIVSTYMRTLKEYDPEPLIEAVTGIDWDMEHARHAVQAIQETVLKNTGDHVSDADAVKLLGRLVERRFIRTRMDSPDGRIAATGWSGRARKAKYFRVPEDER